VLDFLRAITWQDTVLGGELGLIILGVVYLLRTYEPNKTTPPDDKK
jgi:hypothetical protein